MLIRNACRAVSSNCGIAVREHSHELENAAAWLLGAAMAHKEHRIACSRVYFSYESALRKARTRDCVFVSRKRARHVLVSLLRYHSGERGSHQGNVAAGCGMIDSMSGMRASAP